MTFPSDRRSPKADVKSVVTIDLSPDGGSLVSGGTDGEIAVWDTASLTKSAILARGSAPILKVKFSPDGKLVAATNERNELSLLRAEAKAGGVFNRFFGGSTKSAGAAEGLLDVVFSADGKRVAAAAKDSIVNILDLKTLKVIKSLRGDKVVALSPKGDLLASANFVQTMAKDYMEVVVVSVESGTGRAVVRNESWVNALAFSLDGQFLACGLMEGLGLGDRSHHVAVWRMPSYERVSSEIKHDRGQLMDYITGVAFTPDGRHLVSACVDGTVAVWHVGRFDRAQTLSWEGAHLTSLAVTNKRIAVVAESAGFGVWG